MDVKVVAVQPSDIVLLVLLVLSAFYALRIILRRAQGTRELPAKRQ
jgi:hypothetical protein